MRYVDLMESSIAQSLHKGFEREKWNVKGAACTTSEDLLWKLEALQNFIRDLHWPDEVFAEHLDNRLKLMASDMIETAAKRCGTVGYIGEQSKSAAFASCFLDAFQNTGLF